jgi:hypothetical protein
VFQKGRNKSDRWDDSAPAYGRYWKDVPGARPRRVVVCLGICRTRSIAGRKTELWLKSLASRKRNPLEQTTIDNRRYALDKWIYPFLGDCTLGEINNRTVKELVEKMAENLAASSIRDYVNAVKAVIASAIDGNGEQLFPRKWNDEYIDAPRMGEYW